MNRQGGRPVGHSHAGPARLGRRCLATAAAVAALSAAALAASSAGPGGIGTGGFGITPAPDSQGRVAAYFSLTIAAGQSATATVVISNPENKTQELRLGRSIGVTAANGSSAYSAIAQGCSGPGCWITGLPRQITLPAQTRELLNFTVRVPAGTARGQYLGGISAGPAVKPRSVKVGSNGKATARAIIVEQATVGVAVTVGQLSTLTTRFQIPGVQGAIEGPTARLDIQLENTGQTFAHGTGRASCTAAGKRHSYTVYANTVLPHEQALIPVNAPGLPEGATLPCQIRIHYGRQQAVSWTGLVTIPGASGSRIVHTGPGVYTVIPRQEVPVWAIVLICTGGLILAGIGVLLFRSR